MLMPTVHGEVPAEQASLTSCPAAAPAEFGQSLAQRQALRAADPVRSPNQPISIAVISTWPPTACGVASFALNSITALQQVLPAGSRLEVRRCLDTRCSGIRAAANTSYQLIPMHILTSSQQ
jgi:hypothetical protein